MKKTLIVIIVLIIIGAVVWRTNLSTSPSTSGTSTTTSQVNEPSVPSSQTVKISEKLSEYKNDELGFSVKYPTTWEKVESPTSVSLVVPTADEKEKNTVAKIESKINVNSGKCAFPPVTTIKERNSITVKDLTFNMISMSNTLQGKTYFNRMYSLQKGPICYYFTLSAITSSPSSKGYTGTDAQKIGARNTALVDTADTQFKDMVKSFVFVVGPAGQDEAKVSPKK
jgi:hypothetical protein